MSAARILEAIASAGATLRREGDHLKLKPVTAPADLVELVRAHKAELLQLLPDGVSAKISAPQTATTDLPAAQVPQAARSNVYFLRRSVTCATCQHQQLRPDTSEAGMHDCARGHGLRFACYGHDCPDWKPKP